ncbi:MAG: NUDIX domain-containing protein [Acidimicrobiia bacterium]|nr:NUDIX domain-containing protein [Acidimicrobiia bacterium]
MTAESDFLASYDPTEFDRPSTAVDVALVTIIDDQLRVLVLRRPDHPYRGSWQLPGGFVEIDESLDQAAARVIADKAGLADTFIEQLYTFGAPDRDPRTRVITIAYYALVEPDRLVDLPNGVELATIDVPWEGETGGPVALHLDGGAIEVAFDHEAIVGMVVQRLRGKLDYAPVGYELLPDEFTLHDLQRIHETVLGRSLNKDSFRRRMVATREIEGTGRRQTGVGYRPAELYRVR